MRTSWIRYVPFVLLTMIGACNGDDDTGQPGGAGRATAGTAGSGGSGTGGSGSGGAGSGGAGAGGATADAGGDAAVKLDDAQVAGVLHAANIGEVEAARLAEAKASDADVKTFAMQMDTDHSMADVALLALSQDGGMSSLVPADSPVSEALTTTAMQKLQALQVKTGADFDRTYINDQVEIHTQVLALITNVLLPQVTNAALKTQVMMAETAFTMHLTRAQTIQQKLSGDGGPSDAAGGG